MVIPTAFLNRRRLIVKTITDAVKKINIIRVVVSPDGTIQYEQLADIADIADAAFLQKYPGAGSGIVVINKILEEEDVNRYAIICPLDNGTACYVHYDFNRGDVADDEEINLPIQALYPTFSITSDPEVISDISLAGNRLQRFLPILIQGYVSLKDEFDKVESVKGPEREQRRSATNLLGEAYADAIVAVLTTTENANMFSSAFGPDCYGFSLERIGPVIVDNFNAQDGTTRALISVQVQTSFVQDS